MFKPVSPILLSIVLIFLFAACENENANFKIVTAEYQLSDSIKQKLKEYEGSGVVLNTSDRKTQNLIAFYKKKHSIKELDSRRAIDSLSNWLNNGKLSDEQRLECRIELAHRFSQNWNVSLADSLYAQIEGLISRSKWKKSDLKLHYLLLKIDHLKRRKDDYVQSLEECQKILAIIDPLDSLPSQLAIKCHLELSDIFRFNRNYQYALSHAYYALRLWKESTFHKKENIEGMIYGSIGVAWASHAKYPTAQKWLNKAIETLRGRLEYKSFFASYHSTLGILYEDSIHLKSYVDSLYREGIEKTDSSDFYRKGYAHYRYGRYLNRQKNYQEALQQTHLANKYYGELLPDGRHKFARALATLGNIYKSQGKMDSALFYKHKAVLADIADFNNDDMFALPRLDQIRDYYNVTGLIEQKADVLLNYSRENDLPISIACDHFLLVDTLMQSIKSTEDISDIHFSETIHNTYEKILHCISLDESISEVDRLKRIWGIIEQYKVGNLLESKYANARKSFRKYSDNHIQTVQNQLQQIILKLNDFESDHIPEFENLAGQLYPLQKELRLMGNKEDLEFEEKPLSLKEVQTRLDSNEQVLHFFLGKEEIFVVAVTDIEAKYFTSKYDQGQEQKLIKQFVEMLGTGKSNISKLNSLGAHLYEKYLAPSLFPGKERTYVLYDNELAMFPFEVLYNKDQETYLIEDFNFVYSYASCNIFNRQNKENNDILNLSSFSFSDASTIIAQTKESRSNLAELPYAFRETQFLDSLDSLSVSVNTGQDCNRSNLFSSFEKGGILHIASHVIVDTKKRLNNYLVMRAGESLDTAIVYQFEIANVENDFDLVFLAACETGKSKMIMGAEPYSLAKAFLDGGAKTVIQTLWELDDRVSFELVKFFYTGYFENREVGDALRNAKLGILHSGNDKHTHPFYWGGVVVVY